jgi:hypothetical protein
MATRTNKNDTKSTKSTKKSGNGKRTETAPVEAKPAAVKPIEAKAARAETKPARKTAPKKADVVQAPVVTQDLPGSAEEWSDWVRTAAYFLAEQDGFSGDPAGYWVAAERQVRNHY